VDDEAPDELSDLLREVCQRYGLSTSSTAHRLTDGYANDVFRVDCAGDAPVVLHFKHPPSRGESLDWEHSLVRAVSLELPEALTANHSGAAS